MFLLGTKSFLLRFGKKCNLSSSCAIPLLYLKKAYSGNLLNVPKKKNKNKNVKE